ncbi:hypothetical protein GCM10009851_02760 [Herbiconiux moechotypicola]|uniref:Uncharacterized protein n=1 Tax=Herbiconiux moechotypicola TaxID=637393 RepID=A0ABP5Q4A4_9MICO
MSTSAPRDTMGTATTATTPTAATPAMRATVYLAGLFTGGFRIGSVVPVHQAKVVAAWEAAEDTPHHPR